MYRTSLDYLRVDSRPLLVYFFADYANPRFSFWKLLCFVVGLCGTAHYHTILYQVY